MDVLALIYTPANGVLLSMAGKRKTLFEEISDAVLQNYKKKTAKTFKLDSERQPRLFKMALFALVPVFIVSFGFSMRGLPFVGTISTAIYYKASAQPTGVGGLDCEQYNPKDWELLQGDLNFDGSRYSVSDKETGGLLYYKDQVAIDSELSIAFASYSEAQMNFVVTMFGLYEIVVGDGDLRRTTVKMWDQNTEIFDFHPSVDERNYVELPSGEIATGTDVRVIIDQGVSSLGDGSFVLDLQLATDSFLDGQLARPTAFATYQFPLPPEFKYEQDKAWFAVGLKESNDDSEVSAEIWCADIN